MQETFSGCRVTVMGLGTFGGGIAAARFLAQRGAVVTVTDLRPSAELADSVALLADLPEIRLHLGGHAKQDFTGSDLIVASPAVKPESSWLALARQAGVPITSELRLFWERCPARIVGVTGSNGKSTTATLIHDVLKADGRCVWLGGNIGRSLLSELENIRPEDWVVLELSSFQLADLDMHRLSPHIAVMTNITPNHLDWHGSMEAYVAAKQTVFRWQTESDFAIRHSSGIESDWGTEAQPFFCRSKQGGGETVLVSVTRSAENPYPVLSQLQIDFSRCLQLRFRHQKTNAALAAATGLALKVAPEAITSALESFSGIPHRLQSLKVPDGRRFINDSASTTPESTIAALHAIETPTVLIVGGAEKGCDLEPLAEAIVHQADAVIIIGAVKDQLSASVSSRLASREENAPPALLREVRLCETLLTAVDAAIECAPAGANVLFSPGFSSGTMFRNFSDRGQEFVDLVRKRVKS